MDCKFPPGLGEIREGPSQGNLGGGGFPGDCSGQRQKNSYLIELNTSRYYCHKCLVAGASRELPCVHRGFEPFVFKVFTRGRPSSVNFLNLCRGLLPKPMQSFFIQLFGEDFPRLCDEEAVSPDCESLRVLQNTQVCDSSKFENDAVGEEAATHTASEAAMKYAARRVEALPYEASGSSGKQHVKRARLD